MPWRAPGRFEHLPGYLEKYSDCSYITWIQLLQALTLFCNRIFSSSNKFKGHKITDLTRPIEFGPSNRSTSYKEPSGIRPLGWLIYNKDPSCYKAEHTLLGLLFPLSEHSASKTGVSGAILSSLLGLGVICRHLSTQASSAMITLTRDWSQVNRREQATNWHGTVWWWNVSLIARLLLLAFTDHLVIFRCGTSLPLVTFTRLLLLTISSTSFFHTCPGAALLHKLSYSWLWLADFLHLHNCYAHACQEGIYKLSMVYVDCV
jgi:hypothetical protein